MKVTFPNFTTGRFEIQVFRKSDAVGINAPTFTGNVTAVFDMWLVNGYTDRVVGGSAGVNTVSIVHVDVRPATAGVDNIVTLPFVNVNGSESRISIRPYNPDLKLIWESADTGATVVPT